MSIKTWLGMMCVECYSISFYLTNFLRRVVNFGLLTDNILQGLVNPQSSRTNVGAIKTLNLFGCSYVCIKVTWMKELTGHTSLRLGASI